MVFAFHKMQQRTSDPFLGASPFFEKSKKVLVELPVWVVITLRCSNAPPLNHAKRLMGFQVILKPLVLFSNFGCGHLE
jgi:hypothetical protein